MRRRLIAKTRSLRTSHEITVRAINTMGPFGLAFRLNLIAGVIGVSLLLFCEASRMRKNSHKSLAPARVGGVKSSKASYSTGGSRASSTVDSAEIAEILDGDDRQFLESWAKEMDKEIPDFPQSLLESSGWFDKLKDKVKGVYDKFKNSPIGKKITQSSIFKTLKNSALNLENKIIGELKEKFLPKLKQEIQEFVDSKLGRKPESPPPQTQ